jgi:Domain of unknown function (DUF932)
VLKIRLRFYCGVNRHDIRILLVSIPKQNLNNAIPGLVIIERFNTQKLIHGNVGSITVTTGEFNGKCENGWVPVRALEQSIRTEARRGFQKHVVCFARVQHLQTWEKNQVRPEVVPVNSHDKSSVYQLHCGLFRLVCTNSLIVSDDTFQRISIKHFRFNPDSVIQASFDLLNAVPDIMNKVQVFMDLILTDEERLAFATGAATHRWDDLTKAPVSATRPESGLTAAGRLRLGQSRVSTRI